MSRSDLILIYYSTGKKLTSYGGNLTIFHRSVFSGSPVEDSEVIMRGRDGTVLHYGLGAGHRTSDRETSDRFMFTVRL